MTYALAINLTKFPCEGPRFVNCPCDFSLAEQILFDISTMIGLGGISDLQSVYIDASDSTEPVTVQVASTGHRLVIPPYSEALLPIFFNPTNGAFSVSCADSAVFVAVILLNNPVIPRVWLTVNSAVPANAILDSDGNPIRDSDGNYILGT